MNPLRPGPRPKCIATVCLSGTLPEKLEAAAAAGFDGIEIFESDLLNFDGSPARVRQMAADLGLAIMLYQPFRDFEAMPRDLLARNLARAQRKFDVMAELGVETVLVCSNVQDIAIDDPARAADDLRQMAEAAAQRGLRVGYEALAWGRHTRRWRQAWQIVQQADHSALGLILDSFHTLSLGDTLDGIQDVPADKLFFVQFADAPKLSMDVLSWSRHHRNFPGQGDLPVAAFACDLLAAGYAGPLSLEVFNDEFRSAPARLTALDGMRSLIWLESEAGGVALPEPARFVGVDFLEFAVDATAGRELEARLRALGFGLAGHHRSKAVDLYRQGGVNVILNMEQDSAASEHFQLHGPSVCAIGLKVDDAERAMTRARALCCQEWRGPVGPSERSIPALRAPDGTLLYLIDDRHAERSIYESDFILQPEAQSDATGLASIDHVAQALPAHRLDSFVLFYRAVFGMQAEAVQEIADPYGLVKSRAMVSPDRNLRIPLNVSESGHTATGRFIAAYAGSGVHHIAFRTDRLFDTVEAIDRSVARMLHVPENYYDDVAARLGLDDTLLTRLHDDGLLYDRDPHGDFLHVYTEPFRERFFFELVQRDGYLGYGAANAAVRMAVQAQMSRTGATAADR
ncbi:sugar phosphate isomerase/epimerase and 4-hydroxyphenylpyruvate domain-containing protein [Ralstonia insidiosa]|uniref:3-dehydroshikimate dehydratase n=1 Tax=Ralstonia insidiosa TaxID=190721 RepID=A0A192A3D0_9RALS|nr:sugar phosphate isomerase/epimerase and 4-hydroxyphenylpyruvate domain-containing protein [Ralstonia insidiosa]ANJ74853.1 3-keto-5-aminohexanoate cleavage protein [Ralstonia insidiosa]KAB0467354.1 sugar phosphate isomerase/epimerase and 4-hydroxyphenylpyruvate domain-containing protein [Ralstonia insidiosa]MBY4909470.1 sugar phosphate isomerase/epimerase and 4-hydroxyphenylpyruvate domain-containing protein [Ralstonia insidiosa]